MDDIVKKVIFENYIYKYLEYIKYINKNLDEDSETINMIKKNILEFQLHIERLKPSNEKIKEDNTYKTTFIESEQLIALRKQIYCVKWSKLNTEKKHNRIYVYLKEKNLELNYNNVINLYSNKKITSKQIDYNELDGTIENINNLDKYLQ